MKQAYAQIPGAPRTFVHKCHGGPDSLVTSREAFEVTTASSSATFEPDWAWLTREITAG